MECKVVNMTPELASHYLSNNPSNRPMSKSRVEVFAGMMASGQWLLNGETIVISQTGKLLDGQHRLSAVMKYNGPVLMLVATGAPDAAFATIDIGAKRSAGQICAMNGIQSSHIVASAAGVLFRLLHNLTPTTTVPPPYILEVIARYPELSQWSLKARACRGVISSSALLAMLVYLDAIARRPDLAELLADGLKTGEKLERGNPVLTLRNRALAMRGNSGAAHIRSAWIALVRTIDAMEEGAPLVMIKTGAVGNATKLRPARFASHARRLDARRSLRDLVPPGVVFVEPGLVCNGPAI